LVSAKARSTEVDGTCHHRKPISASNSPMPSKSPKPKRSPKPDRVTEAPIPAEKLEASFPKLKLPIQPPFAPMEAKLVDEIPSGARWQYEPKWDGFRCLVFRDGDEVVLQSKAGQPLGRYFPELVEAVRALKPDRFILDGEIVIELDGHLSFDDLLQRIHPAASRIAKLSKSTPSTLLAFDLLLDAKGKQFVAEPLEARREHLESFFKSVRSDNIKLSPATTDRREAERWMRELAATGCDGVVAKCLDDSYVSGERAMRKIKRIRTADCVVGGYRLASKGGAIGSLLLGLYDDFGKLNHVGFSSSFTREERGELKAVLEPYQGGEGFTGAAPGGPSRWSTERSTEWVPLAPKLVCEVRYDHFSGGRFRHGTKFLRWRPDKKAKACTYDQLTGSTARNALNKLLAA
jgi:ATP-dependent DNA ligase